MDLARIASLTLLILGIISLVNSVIFSSTHLAFIGLGLTFWGALLLYIKPTKYIKASLLHSIVLPTLSTLNQIVTELNIKGKAIYLPPKTLEEIKKGKMFIPTVKETTPKTKKLSQKTIFSKNPHGIYITPPGNDLTNLYEETLGTTFTKVDLNYLQANLPKLLIEDLEIAEDIEINIQKSKIQIKIISPIFGEFCKQAREYPNICNSIGCPICSSLACAITRITAKPVTIENAKLSENAKIIDVTFRILEES